MWRLQRPGGHRTPYQEAERCSGTFQKKMCATGAQEKARRGPGGGQEEAPRLIACLPVAVSLPRESIQNKHEKGYLCGSAHARLSASESNRKEQKQMFLLITLEPGTQPDLQQTGNQRSHAGTERHCVCARVLDLLRGDGGEGGSPRGEGAGEWESASARALYRPLQSRLRTSKWAAAPSQQAAHLMLHLCEFPRQPQIRPGYFRQAGVGGVIKFTRVKPQHVQCVG